MSDNSTPSVRFDGFTNDCELRQASHNVPAVRFKADDGSDFPDWEEKKLGDIATIVMGQSPDSKNYSEDPIGKVLVQGNADLKNGKVSPRIWTTESPKSAEPGSLLMTVRAPVGALAITDIPVALGRGVCAITGPEILYYQLAQVENNHYWDRVSAGSTFKAIDSNSIAALKLCCPSESEQKKIASLLSYVDETLTLSLRKLDLLTQAKKALMQQIFSQKLRFKADDGSDFPEWEEKKLGNLFVKAGSGGTPKSSISEYYGGDINFLSISDVSESNGHIVQTTKKLTESGLQHSTAWIVPKGSISLAMYASVGKVAILDIDAATSQAFYNMTFSDDDLRDLLYQKLTMVNDEGGWIPLISTGTQPNLNAEKVRNYVISLPSNRTEMHRINLVLHSADALIAQARAELEQWQDVKKSLLQQLFV